MIKKSLTVRTFSLPVLETLFFKLQREVILHLESIKFLTCCEQLVTKTEKTRLFMQVPQLDCVLSLSLFSFLSISLRSRTTTE